MMFDCHHTGVHWESKAKWSYCFSVGIIKYFMKIVLLIQTSNLEMVYIEIHPQYKQCNDC